LVNSWYPLLTAHLIIEYHDYPGNSDHAAFDGSAVIPWEKIIVAGVNE